MAILKLLLPTCLMLIVSSALAAKEDTESYDVASFNITLQDSVIRPTNYKLQFSIEKSWVVSKTLSNITFEISEPISHIGLYTNGQKIIKSEVWLEYFETYKDNRVWQRIKPQKYYERKDILIMQFPVLSASKNYYLSVEYYSTIPKYYFEVENSRRDQSEDSRLCRILESSSDFGTISLTSMYAPYRPKINIIMEIPDDAQLFLNSEQKHIVPLSTNYTANFTLSSMSIHQAMFLMTKNFEKTQLSEIVFWYTPKIKNEIQYAIEISYNLSPYFGYYNPIMPTEEHDIRVRNIISSYDEYPTVSSLGLTVYRQKDVFFNKTENYFARKAAVAMTVSYAMSRQTLCYIVYKCSWMTEYLQESLAVYLHYKILDKIQPYLQTNLENSSMSYLFVVQILQTSLHDNDIHHMKPILYEINNTDEIDKSLSLRLYYNKGAALFRILESTIGTTVMQDVISNYIKKYAFFCAYEEHFWDTMQETVNAKKPKWQINFKQIMHSWLSQEYYPEIHVRMNQTYEALRVNLQQYPAQNRICPNEKCNCTNCIWPVFSTICPFSFEKGFMLVEEDIHLNEWYTEQAEFNYIKKMYDFVILNCDQTSYYRINYDVANWMKIAQFLNHGNYTEIHVLSRAQLIDDSYYFMMNGQLNWPTFLNLINYLKRETSYIAWYPMINIMSYMKHFFNHPSSKFIKPSLAEMFGKLIENIGYLEYESDDDMIKSLRLLGSWWACKLGYPGCREMAKYILFVIFDKPQELGLFPWWKKWVYCAGMMEGWETVFDAMIDKYLLQREEHLIRFMACTEKAVDVTHLFFRLESFKNSETPVNKSNLEYDHLSHFVKRHATNETMVQFIVNHIEYIIPGVLYNIQFWADIVLNIYIKEDLNLVNITITLIKLNYTVFSATSPLHATNNVMQMILSKIPKDHVTYHIVKRLIDLQLRRIYKLYDTNYYI